MICVQCKEDFQEELNPPENLCEDCQDNLDRDELEDQLNQLLGE